MSCALRIGIVGCGSVMRGCYMPVVQDLHAKGLVEAAAACDIDETKRAFVRDTFGIATFTTDYRELVTAANVDLVLVLTSMNPHGPIARAALEAGKHVLVEKPMATSLAEAAALVELAKKSPGRFVCAPHVILSPTHQAMARRIRRGDIGRVFSARAFYGHGGPTWGPWFYRKGGGALFDLGVYNLTSLTSFLGPAKRVTALTGVAIPERTIEGERVQVEAEDNAHVLLDFGAGTFAVVSAGFTIQRYRCPAIEVYGNKGTIQMLGDDWAPRGYELWQNGLGAWQIFDETTPGWSWTDGLRHLIDCIRAKTVPIITPAHAYHALEIMIKAQESAQDGQAKSLTSVFDPPDFGSDASCDRRH